MKENLQDAFSKIIAQIAPRLPNLPIMGCLYIDLPTKSLTYQNDVKNGLSEEQIKIKQLEKAVKNPSKLEGEVIITLLDETIFQVKNGEVLVDVFRIAPKISEVQVYKKLAGQSVIASINDLLTSGEQEAQIRYTGKNYTYTKNQDQIKVFNKEGTEILNNQGFTDKATVQDMQNMEKLRDEAQKLDIANDLSPRLKL